MKKDKLASAIIVAAGSGTRMGSISKPLIKIGGMTIIERVADVFDHCEHISEIIVVEKEAGQFESIVKCTKPVKFVTGGKTRADSVRNGVAASSAPYVCIHDCARPFITANEVEKVLNAAFLSDAACACAKVNDTIKYRSEEEKCFYTPKRDNLIAVQTPQVFKKSVWAVADAIAQKKGVFNTDDTTAVEQAGFGVDYVECSAFNFKLTDANDVKIAKAIYFLKEHGDL